MPKLLDVDDIPEEETKIGQPPAEPKARRKRSKLEAPVNLQTLKQSLSGTYNGIAFLARTEVRFNDEDFNEESRKLIEFINLFPPLRIIIHLLAPITIVVALVKKLDIIFKERKKKQEDEGKVTINYSPNQNIPTPKSPI